MWCESKLPIGKGISEIPIVDKMAGFREQQT